MKVKIYEFWDGNQVLAILLRIIVLWWSEVRQNHRRMSIDEDGIQESALKISSKVVWAQPNEDLIYLYAQAMRIQ